MARYRTCLTFLLLGLVPSISGCQIVNDLIYGTKNQPPDEFQVVNQPPLSMPPDYGLRPPKPGTARPNEVDPAENSRRSVFGIEGDLPYDLNSENSANRSNGELIILKRAGAIRANPEIRRILNTESGAPAQVEHSLAETLLFMGEEEQKDEALLDPVEEYRRIYGQPVPSAPGTETDDDGDKTSAARDNDLKFVLSYNLPIGD